MQALLASGHACSIAAHDPVLLDQAHTLIQDHNLTGRSSPILS
jgi:hypothetical protein